MLGLDRSGSDWYIIDTIYIAIKDTKLVVRLGIAPVRGRVRV